MPAIRPPEALFVDLVYLTLDAGFSAAEVAWMLDLGNDFTDAPFRPAATAA